MVGETPARIPLQPSAIQLSAFRLPTSDESFYAIAGFANLLVGGGEAGANVASAIFAKGGARHDCYFVLLKQTDREFLFTHARAGDIRKSVEASPRQMALE